jgi:hypothetical protein
MPARYTSDWGYLNLELSDSFVSEVIDTLNNDAKRLTITTNNCDTGVGTGTIYYRGSTDSFNQSDMLPDWVEYSTPITVELRYLQLRTSGQ